MGDSTFGNSIRAGSMRVGWTAGDDIGDGPAVGIAFRPNCRFVSCANCLARCTSSCGLDILSIEGGEPAPPEYGPSVPGRGSQNPCTPGFPDHIP